MLSLLLNFRRRIEDLRDKSHESPYAFMWITLVLSALAIPMGYFSSYASNAKHLAVWALIVTTWVASLVGILYVGGIASWGLRRQAQKKSWGVPLPDEERTWLFRPGVWAGLAVGMFYQAEILVAGAIIWLIMRSHFGLGIIGVSSSVGTVYTLSAIHYFYAIPKRWYLLGLVLAPFSIIALLGIVLAIIFGQIHNYDQAAKRHVEQSSAVVHQGSSPRPAIAPTTTGRFVAPVASIQHPVLTYPFSETFPPQVPALGAPRAPRATPSRSFATVDQHCIGGLPITLPSHSAWHHSGTITALVPRLMAVSTMFETQRAVHGFLDPEYMAGQRVLVHPDGANPGAHLMVVVPAGMVVQVGQKVEVAGAHVSHHFACRYAPNLLVAQASATQDTPSLAGGMSAQYAAEIVHRVYAVWPASFSLELQCRLLVRLNPDGTLRGSPMIEQPSGSDTFDNDAVRAVEKAAPFPLPTGLPYGKFNEVVITLRSKVVANP